MYHISWQELVLAENLLQATFIMIMKSCSNAILLCGLHIPSTKPFIWNKIDNDSRPFQMALCGIISNDCQ